MLELEHDNLLELRDKTAKIYLNYHKSLSKEEEKQQLRELFILKQAWKKEEYLNKRNELTRNYLKYLISKAHKSFIKGFGKTPLEDYISESYLGLLKAFEKFDASKYDNGFLAYWDFYIENNLRKINLQTYWLSSNLYWELINIFKEIKKFMDLNNIYEINQIQDLYLLEIIKDVLNLSSEQKAKQKLIFFRPFLEWKSKEFSLNLDYNNEDFDKWFNLQDNLEDTFDFYQDYSNKEFKSHLVDLILKKINKLLKQDERLINLFKMRFNYLSEDEIKELVEKYKGIMPPLKVDREKYTLQEVGGVFWITRERVRQIEEKIFELIKSDEQINSLKKIC